MIKNLNPKLAEAGKIKIGGLGAKRTSRTGKEFRVPVKYDHFVVTSTLRGNDGDLLVDAPLMEALESDEDGKVRAIPIVLHSDDIDSVFPTSYALYHGKKCVCRGDGETATRREMKNGELTGREKQRECPCEFLNASTGPRCKPTGKLYCSIVVEGQAVAGAVHIWRTTSIISIRQMLGSLQQIKAVVGALKGVPLWLLIRPVTVEPKDTHPKTVYCCHVELRVSDLEKVQQRAMEQARMRQVLGDPDAAYRKMLAAPETDDEQEAVEAEFYPPEEVDQETGEVLDQEKSEDEPEPGSGGAEWRDDDEDPPDRDGVQGEFPL